MRPQGVDWLQLANHTVSIPVSILERLAGGDLSPHTIMAGQRISVIFCLSELGNPRLENALQNLYSCSSWGDAIHFGFGIKHVVRRLAEIKQGLTCIALCGSLSELHLSKASASILMELANACEVPDEVRPSPHQWMNMVETCSGVLKSTTFGIVAEQFMSFHGRDWIQGTMENYKDVANALHAIGRVSSRALQSITLTGGRSCGWIAAIGYWFLGLDVEIQDKDGGLLYRSTDSDERIKILVIYGDSQSKIPLTSLRLFTTSSSLGRKAETIIFLAWNLSAIQIHGDLTPCRSGLQFVYELLAGEAEIDDREHKFGARQKPYKGGIKRLISLLDMGSVYHTAQFLFTTILYPQTTSTFTETSVGGLCFYLNILMEVSDRPEVATLLHVAPGRIETKRGRKYLHVLDITGKSSVGILGLEWVDKGQFVLPAEYSKSYYAETPKTLATFDGGLANNSLATNTGSVDLTATLVIKESPQSLLADFRFHCARGSCQVGAYMLFREIAFCSGLVSCAHRGCPPASSSESIMVVDGEGGLPAEPSQDGIYIYRLSGNSLARCIGLLVDKDSTDSPVILRGRECIECCVTAASLLEKRPAYIIL
ncbi:hypothetical protein G7Y89_g11630 [Cudoniella acicularis]|uniref:Uncharacterized protein n=1 Tax=Cudoniella acicularis TaxID=354080 RepID=A0A8H4RBM4_9HELO|nr:hypothetical protein G7Y89_g11630 [Cudoniella acicularis]